jgi:hypothetical protein
MARRKHDSSTSSGQFLPLLELSRLGERLELSPSKSRTFQPKGRAHVVTCVMYIAGTYRMDDLLTKPVHVSLDVTWLHRMFFSSPKIEAGKGLRPTIDV